MRLTSCMLHAADLASFVNLKKKFNILANKLICLLIDLFTILIDVAPPPLVTSAGKKAEMAV